MFFCDCYNLQIKGIVWAHCATFSVMDKAVHEHNGHHNQHSNITGTSQMLKSPGLFLVKQYWWSSLPQDNRKEISRETI